MNELEIRQTFQRLRTRLRSRGTVDVQDFRDLAVFFAPPRLSFHLARLVAEEYVSLAEDLQPVVLRLPATMRAALEAHQKELLYGSIVQVAQAGLAILLAGSISLAVGGIAAESLAFGALALGGVALAVGLCLMPLVMMPADPEGAPDAGENTRSALELRVSHLLQQAQLHAV